MERTASATGVPCATSTSTWRSLATISSGLCLFLGIAVLLRLESHTSGWTTPVAADHSRRRLGSCVPIREPQAELRPKQLGAYFAEDRRESTVMAGRRPR